MAAFLMIPAGRVTYWQGWLFLGLVFLNLAALILLVPLDLLNERTHPGPEGAVPPDSGNLVRQEEL
jgi:hypothetical protein